jgi:hypothetical protein
MWFLGSIHLWNGYIRYASTSLVLLAKRFCILKNIVPFGYNGLKFVSAMDVGHSPLPVKNLWFSVVYFLYNRM